LFLGRNEEITDAFSDFRIDYFEIPGTSISDSEVRYTYRIDEQENIWEYYFVLFQRLKIYANAPYTIGEMGIGQEDTKEIDALREALVNLLIHSDYFSIKKPRIRVFSNRIEFDNPGGLPLPVEQLMAIDESLPRNPVLAKFFRIAKLCESGGYGFNKMLEWKKQTGNDVIFDTQIGKTTFTFMIDTTKINREESGTINATGGMKSDTKSGMITEQSGTIEQNSGTKSGTIDKILQLINENNTISLTQLSQAIGINRSAIQKHIDNLKNKGIIHRDKAGKGGKWIVAQNTNG
jgi:predicted HTH transcriptional regulator